jgi:type II secretory pathway pseudopilin PulG
MTKPIQSGEHARRRRPDPESGYILLAVLFLVALLVISLAVAAPKVAADIQRDKELELVHRGQQYTRAIKLYYKKFGSYPNSIDQLMNTNDIHYLRRRYTDPLTGKDDWKLVYFGQSHIPAMGPFGQVLAGAAGGGVLGAQQGSVYGQNGQTGLMGSPLGNGGSVLGNGGSVLGNGGSGSTFGNSGGDGSTFGTGGGSGSTFGTGGGAGSTFGNNGGTTPTDPNNPTGTTGTGATGVGTTQDGTGGGPAGSPGAFGTGNPGGSTNPTLGGGPIVGVVSPVTKASIREYKKQKHYNQWEFVYNPLEDLANSGGMGGGVPTNLNGVGNTQGTGLGGPTGGQPPGSSFGGTNPTGNGGTTPPGGTPMPPETNSPQPQ